MLYEDKTFRGFLVLGVRIWWRYLHTLYFKRRPPRENALILRGQ